MDKYLRQFLEVATLKNVSQAAKKMCISQPTLSANIQKLEQSLGTVLFTRSSTGVELTDCGEVLAEHVRMMLRLYDNALMKMEFVKERHERELKIGVGHAWWQLFLRETIATYRRQHPHANLYIDVGNHLRLMDLLLSGDIDLSIGHEIVGLTRQAEVKFLPLFISEDKVYVRRDHPLTYKPACTLEDLAGFPTMEATFNEYRYRGVIEDQQHLQQYNTAHHLHEKTIYSSTSLHTAIDLVNDSNAVMAFPGGMEPFFSRYGLVSLRMADSYWKGTIGIYLRRDMNEDPHINDVLALIHRYVDEKLEAGCLKAEAAERDRRNTRQTPSK